MINGSQKASKFLEWKGCVQSPPSIIHFHIRVHCMIPFPPSSSMMGLCLSRFMFSPSVLSLHLAAELLLVLSGLFLYLSSDVRIGHHNNLITHVLVLSTSLRRGVPSDYLQQGVLLLHVSPLLLPFAAHLLFILKPLSCFAASTPYCSVFLFFILYFASVSPRSLTHSGLGSPFLVLIT